VLRGAITGGGTFLGGVFHALPISDIRLPNRDHRGDRDRRRRTPALSLDPEGVRWLRRLLRELADQGRTILLSSHILAEVAQTVDRVLIMSHGRLIADDTVSDLLSTHEGASLEDVFLELTADYAKEIR
jgi:hypothetical protein